MSHTTYEYLRAVKNLKPLNSTRLHASGLELTIGPIGGEAGAIARIQLDGESVDDLKAVIFDSIQRTLANRKALLQSELKSISDYLEQPE